MTATTPDTLRPAAATGLRRLFPTRLGPPPRPREGAAHAPPSAARVWLLARLWVRHAELERRVADAARRADPAALRALKAERLAVRDRIAALERSRRFPEGD